MYSCCGYIIYSCSCTKEMNKIFNELTLFKRYVVVLLIFFYILLNRILINWRIQHCLNIPIQPLVETIKLSQLVEKSVATSSVLCCKCYKMWIQDPGDPVTLGFGRGIVTHCSEKVKKLRFKGVLCSDVRGGPICVSCPSPEFRVHTCGQSGSHRHLMKIRRPRAGLNLITRLLLKTEEHICSEQDCSCRAQCCPRLWGSAITVQGGSPA